MITIVNQPRAVLEFLAPEGGLYEADYVADRLKRMRALASLTSRVVCNPADAAMCEVFPSWMIEAGPGLIRHSRIRTRITRNPMLAVQVMLAAYDETQPLLERAVLSSGEATVPLLGAIDEGRVKPRFSRETYEQVLVTQPWWGMRYLQTPCPTPELKLSRARMFSWIVRRCADDQQKDPQAALVHLLLNPAMDPVPMGSILCKDPMVAYLASRLLGTRGLDLRVEQVDPLDSRWATHIALWGAFTGGNVDARVEDAIAKDAAWTGEYIARNETRQKDWTWVREMYGRVDGMARANPPTEPDMWPDLLWALLDRLCLQVEGKNPRLTFQQSVARNAPATDDTSAKTDVTDSGSAATGGQN
jgi:hypothetical protein